MANNEFGDFQTPIELARLCVERLQIEPAARILEPTCGVGAFLEAAADISPRSERVGYEINPEYVQLASKWGRVDEANAFEIDFDAEAKWQTDGPLYVIGNPPWVTAAELARMGSKNLPVKENFKNAKGLEAVLGASNFDVCEFLIFKILNDFSHTPFTMAMLCKTQVARNVIDYCAQNSIGVTGASVHQIDALQWFGASVDACWFTLEIQPGEPGNYSVKHFNSVTEAQLHSPKRFGIVNGRMVSDIEKYRKVAAADGESRHVWRSGMKHDAARIFELSGESPTSLHTKAGEKVDIETEHVFPLLKSTDVFRGRHNEITKWVVVPQLKFGDDTAGLKQTAPKLWAYLNEHGEALDARKSSIYRNRPRFSVFGLGDYSFAPYKVAVSGLHKEAVFRLVAPQHTKPVFFDDTCYLLPFDNINEAATTAAILNSRPCQNLIDSLVFWDAKRPISKRLLTRLDLDALELDTAELTSVAQRMVEEVGGRIGTEKLLSSTLR